MINGVDAAPRVMCSGASCCLLLRTAEDGPAINLRGPRVSGMKAPHPHAAVFPREGMKHETEADETQAKKSTGTLHSGT